MNIYYYHTRPIQEALNEWENHLHPGHILYGLTHFQQFGITPVLHNFRRFSSRLKLSFYNFFQIIRCKKPYDLLYGTSFYGLELIIFCRALGLYRKPIAIWHHQAVIRNPNPLRNIVSRFFYKGIDQMFFFSRRLINESLKSGKVSASQLHLIHWGADMDFYNYLREHFSTLNHSDEEKDFITTGKEHRDFATLLKAFAKTGLPIDIFTTPDKEYKQLIDSYAAYSNTLFLAAVVRSVRIPNCISLFTAFETVSLECWRGRWNSLCSGEMRRYKEEHQWRRRSTGQ